MSETEFKIFDGVSSGRIGSCAVHGNCHVVMTDPVLLKYSCVACIADKGKSQPAAAMQEVVTE